MDVATIERQFLIHRIGALVPPQYLDRLLSIVDTPEYGWCTRARRIKELVTHLMETDPQSARLSSVAQAEAWHDACCKGFTERLNTCIEKQQKIVP